MSEAVGRSETWGRRGRRSGPPFPAARPHRSTGHLGLGVLVCEMVVKSLSWLIIPSGCIVGEGTCGPRPLGVGRAQPEEVRGRAP